MEVSEARRWSSGYQHYIRKGLSPIRSRTVRLSPERTAQREARRHSDGTAAEGQSNEPQRVAKGDFCTRKSSEATACLSRTKNYIANRVGCVPLRGWCFRQYSFLDRRNKPRA